MSACEICWNEAFVQSRLTGRPQAEIYRELLADPNHRGENRAIESETTT